MLPAPPFEFPLFQRARVHTSKHISTTPAHRHSFAYLRIQSNPGHKRFGRNYREDRTVPRKTERGYVDSRPGEGEGEFSHRFLSGFRVDSVPPPRERSGYTWKPSQGSIYRRSPYCEKLIARSRTRGAGSRDNRLERAFEKYLKFEI